MCKSKHASLSRVLHPTQVWLNSLPMQLGRRLMNIEAIFRRPRGEQTDRQRAEGEARWTWTGPVTFPFSFLESEKKFRKIRGNRKKNWKWFFAPYLRVVTGLCICRPPFLGCYLQIRRTMRGRGGWKAVRLSDESPGGRSTRVTRKPPKFCKKRKIAINSAVIFLRITLIILGMPRLSLPRVWMQLYLISDIFGKISGTSRRCGGQIPSLLPSFLCKTPNRERVFFCAHHAQKKDIIFGSFQKRGAGAVLKTVLQCTPRLRDFARQAYR